MLRDQYYPDSKSGQRHHKRSKQQTNVPYEYKYKNFQQNTSKPNPAVYIKDYTL